MMSHAATTMRLFDGHRVQTSKTLAFNRVPLKERFTPVVDAMVSGLIHHELTKFAAEPGCCGAVEAAFYELLRRRRVLGRSLDENLAAAEHYMFARLVVCQGTISVTQMRATVIGYDGLKMVGVGPLMRSSRNPTAPGSLGAIRWGARGVRDGDAQHSRCNASTIPPAFNHHMYTVGNAGRSEEAMVSDLIYFAAM